MKRVLDLCRDIIISIKENNNQLDKNIKKRYTWEARKYNLDLLVGCNYINKNESNYFLTEIGFEVYESIKDNNYWNIAKKIVIDKIGSFDISFEVLIWIINKRKRLDAANLIKEFYKIDCDNFLYKLKGHSWIKIDVIEDLEGEEKINRLKNNKTIKLFDFR